MSIKEEYAKNKQIIIGYIYRYSKINNKRKRDRIKKEYSENSLNVNLRNIQI